MNDLRSTKSTSGPLIRFEKSNSPITVHHVVGLKKIARYPPGTPPVPPRYSPGTPPGTPPVPPEDLEKFSRYPPGTPPVPARYPPVPQEDLGAVFWWPARYPLEARPVPLGVPPGTPWCPARYPLVSRPVPLGRSLSIYWWIIKIDW